MGLFDSNSKSETAQTETSQYAEDYGVTLNLAGGKKSSTKIALPNGILLDGSSKAFFEGGGSDYTNANILSQGAVFTSGYGNVVNINAPDQMFELLSEVVDGAQAQQAETIKTVQSMQKSAEERLTAAIDLSERVSTQTGEVIAFIKQASPFVFIGAVIYIAGKKFLQEEAA